MLAAILLFGCAARAPFPRRPAATPVSPARWETQTFERTAGTCGESRPDCVRVSLSYPVSAAKQEAPVDKAVSWFVEKHLLAPAVSKTRPPDMEALAAQFVYEYEQVKNELKDYRSNWYLEREVTVVFADARAVSLCFSETSYTGGAHPNSYRRYRSFDSATGRPLAIEHLVVPGGLEALEAEASRAFRRMYEIAPGVSLAEAGFWFENGRFHLNDNFAVTSKGLLFYFNLYEITSYARGPTALLLSFPELKGILKDKWTD